MARGILWSTRGQCGSALSTNGLQGDGIFKSLDNGEIAAAIHCFGDCATTDPFDFIYKLLTFEEEGVLAATQWGFF